MDNRFKFLCAAAAGAGLLLMTCNNGDNPGGPGGSSAAWTYTVDGTSLIILHPEEISTRCEYDNLVADTTPAYRDTVGYRLFGDTLRVEDGDHPGDSLTLVRIGTGSGLQGQWRMTMEGVDITITVGASTITASVCMADMVMLEASGIEFYYNITVIKLSCNSVMLIGNTSGEQVTLSYTPVGNTPDNLEEGDITISSSNPQHAPVTVYANPTSCPNSGPAWYNQFLSDNPAQHPAAKSAAEPALQLLKLPKIRVFR